jgi:hypothetical protein
VCTTEQHFLREKQQQTCLGSNRACKHLVAVQQSLSCIRYQKEALSRSGSSREQGSLAGSSRSRLYDIKRLQSLADVDVENLNGIKRQHVRV